MKNPCVTQKIALFCAVLVTNCCLSATSGLSANPAGAAAGQPSGFTLPPGLEARIWASEPAFSNTVAVSVAPDGRIYATQTRRRKANNLDIREQSDWINQELGFRSVADKANWYRQALAPEHSAKNTKRVADYNGDGSHDWRDLQGLSEAIHEFRDTDGDGVADRHSVYAEGFNTIVTGTAAGVLFHDGDVYATITPDVWKMRDMDGDGVSDQRSKLATGFGVHIAYAGHNMHGLTVGPDGRIYWSIGDIASDYLPHEGAVFRCWPDGSGFEVFCRGLRNPQELAFDDFGNLFTGDNDGDFGDLERWLHLVEGGDYGWRFRWQYQVSERWGAEPDGYSAWNAEKMWHKRHAGQGVWHLPPVEHIGGGPCGLVFYPGTGLGEGYKDHFFLVHFTGSAANSGITQHQLTADGATFTMSKQEDFVKGVTGTGIDFGPDGAIYLADWAGGYPLNERGRIHRIFDPRHAQSDLVKETRTLLGSSFEGRTPKELQPLLAHADKRVRQYAHFALARKGAAGQTVLRETATRGTDLRARVHAIWGLGLIARIRPDTARDLLPLLDDPEAEIRAQAAKLLADLRFKAAGPRLLAMLQDPEPRPRLYAAFGVGKTGPDGAVPALFEFLEQVGEEDAFLRHAGIAALEWLTPLAALTETVTHPSAAVRLGAVLALRRLENPAVQNFLQDSDPQIVVGAARAINDLPIESARDALADRIESGPTKDEALERRVLNANFRLGTDEHARRLAAYAANPQALDSLRLEALRMLGQWTEPNPRDRVVNLWLPLDTSKRHAGPAREAVETNLLAILNGDDALRAEAARMAARLNLDVDPQLFLAWVKDTERASGARIAGLEMLGARGDQELQPALEVALNDPDPGLFATALRLRAQEDPKQGLAKIQSVLKDGTLPARQSAIRVLGALKQRDAIQVFEQWVEKLLNRKAPPGLALDLYSTAEAEGSKRLKSKVDQWAKALEKAEPLGLASLVLEGGDPGHGETLFVVKAELQCLRCHKAGGERASQGGDVAPNLAGLGKQRDARYLAEAILYPNRSFAPGFEQVVVTTREGREWNGRLAAETRDHVELEVPADVDEEELAILGPNAPRPTRKVRIPKSDIAKREAGLSPMPEGLGAMLTLEELRDLVAYLQVQ